MTALLVCLALTQPMDVHLDSIEWSASEAHNGASCLWAVVLTEVEQLAS
jgi:hypothetical protein